MKLRKGEIKAYLAAIVVASLLPGIFLVFGLALGVEWAVYVLLSLGSFALFALVWLLAIDPALELFDKDGSEPPK